MNSSKNEKRARTVARAALAALFVNALFLAWIIQIIVSLHAWRLEEEVPRASDTGDGEEVEARSRSHGPSDAPRLMQCMAYFTGFILIQTLALIALIGMVGCVILSKMDDDDDTAAQAEIRRLKNQLEQSGRLLECFQLTQIIGAGGFGIALRGKNLFTQGEVAIKIIPQDMPNSNWSPKQLENETRMIFRIPGHPNLVQYFSHWKEQLNHAQLAQLKTLIGKTLKLSIPANLPSMGLICIEMELCTSNLKTWLKSRSMSAGMNARKSYRIFLQLVDGLEHIHANNLIHRDLKPTNILIYVGGQSPQVKIADFGLAVLHSQSTDMDYHTTNAGNALYRAPEQGGNKYGKAVDIYALGLILYELFDPTAQVNVGESLVFLKFNQKLPSDSDLESEYPIVVKSILEMIKYKPEERPSFARIRELTLCSRDKSQSGSGNSGSGGGAEGDGDGDWFDDYELMAQLAAKFEADCHVGDGAGKACSGCASLLTFPRFKCCICTNVVLCKYCEDGTTTKTDSRSLSFHGHSSNHAMLKLKRTASVVPPVTGVGSLKIQTVDKNGCKHYRRKCQLHCPTCNEYFWCRFCHDEARGGDHEFDRIQVGLIKCMACSTPQLVGKNCRKCGITFAQYFCPICHLYDDSKGVLQLAWHCNKCGICRKKPSPEMVYDHCDACGMCYPISSSSSSSSGLGSSRSSTHQCKPNAGKSSCPICQKGVFDSRAPSVLVNGDYVHVACLKLTHSQAAA